MNTANHNPEQMSNPNHCTTMTEVNRVFDLRYEVIQDYYTGIAEGWDLYTMRQMDADIAKLTAMLPEWIR